MSFLSLIRKLRHQWLGRQGDRPARRRRSEKKGGRSFPLTLEQLESRINPVNNTWTGGAGTLNWNDAANWSNGIPGKPGAGLDLLFPAVAGNPSFTLNNNIPGSPVTISSIVFQGTNYTLTGNAIKLAGDITENAGASSDAIQFNVEFTGSANQFIKVNGTDLTISGQLSGTGVDLTKQGLGVLTLGGDNHNFTGNITVDTNSGILQVTNAKALGDTTGGTTVGSQSQLQLNIAAGGTITGERLLLNGDGGAGAVNPGALLNVAGNNTWTGTVQMDSDTTYGVAASSQLTISGTISDTGTGHDFTKRGQGTLVLSALNTYHGKTTIADGILQIRVGSAVISVNGVPTLVSALGTADLNDAAATGTVVTSTYVNGVASEVGTLQINDPTAGGTAPITIQDEQLDLNGAGFGGIGALSNLNGFNTWTGNVNLHAPGGANPNTVIITTQPGTASNPSTLTIGNSSNPGVTGLLQDPSGVADFRKQGTGTLILPFRNTYRGTTWVEAGVLEIRDSNSLGSTLNGTTVFSGATLDLEVDGFTDSRTGTTNKLNITEALTISGTGTSNQGALYSGSGINTYSETISLSGNAAIGVATDPNETPNINYFTNDYTLTLNRPGGSTLVGASTLTKLGDGHLILPQANGSFTGDMDIARGWVTIQDSNSLGAKIAGASQNNQRMVTVEDGAALHLYAPRVGGNLTSLAPPQNFTLTGFGIDHAFVSSATVGGIDQAGGDTLGALVNLAGMNTIAGNITLAGQVGVGVEQVFAESQLYLTGYLTEKTLVINVPPVNGAGGRRESDVAYNVGSQTGTITITADVYSIKDEIQVYTGRFTTPIGDSAHSNPPSPPPGSIKVYDSTTNGNPYSPTNDFSAIITINYTPTSATASAVEILGPNGPTGGGTSMGTGWNTGPIVTPITGWTDTYFTVVVNPGGTNSGTQWKYTVNVAPGSTPAGGITKLGSKMLVVSADGTYKGNVDIKQGVWLNENNTGLGGGTGTVTVESGAALLLANQDPNHNSGLQTGQQIWGEHLVLNGPGNTTLGPTYNLTGGPPIAPLTVLNKPSLAQLAFPLAPDSVIKNDAMWRGPVTLNTSVAIDVQSGSRLNILGDIDDASNASPSGSNLVKITTDGAGNPASELILSGNNSYRGTTYVGTSTTDDPDIGGVKVNEFFGRGVNAPLQGGFLTVASSSGLGAPTGGTIVQDGNALQLEGNITIAGETLTIRGSGVASIPAADQAPQTWFNLGSAPIGDGLTLGTGTNQAVPVTGRITGIAADPLDASTIYISTSDGGAWKTTNNGATWSPLFDAQSGTPMFTGAIVARDPNSEFRYYLGTGEANNSTDSFYGTGVYRTNDGGQTWTLVSGQETQSVTVSGLGGTFQLSFKGDSTPVGALQYNDTAANVEAELEKLGSIAGNNVDVIRSGITEVQQIWVNATGGKLFLSFNGDKIATSLNYNDTAANVQAALNALPSITAAGGVTVRKDNSANDYLVVFNQPGQQPLISGSADPANVLTGTTGNLFGPAVHVIEQRKGGYSYDITFTNTLATAEQPLMVVSAAGVSADIVMTDPYNPFYGKAISKIIIDPTDPTHTRLYVADSDIVTNGTTAGNNTLTGPAGVWRFDGTSWFCLTNVTSDLRGGVLPSANTGFPVYGTLDGGPNFFPLTPGPDDNFFLTLPTSNAVYSDVWESNAGVLYFALGTPGGGGFTPAPSGPLYTGRNSDAGTLSSFSPYNPTYPISLNPFVFQTPTTVYPNAVYRIINPATASTTTKPIVYIGDGNPLNTQNPPQTVYSNGGGTAFPSGFNSNFQINANTGRQDYLGPPVSGTNTNGSIKLIGGTNLSTGVTSVYGAVANATTQALSVLMRTQNGGVGWTAVTPGINYLGNAGAYDSVLATQDGTTVYAGGQANVLMTTNSGGSWADITVDGTGVAPHSAFHAMTFDRQGRLLVGTDGGIWRWDPTASTWTNLNGNLLAITQFAGVGVGTSSPTTVFGGSQSNGVAGLTGSQTWASVLNGTTITNNGGVVRVDPNNPKNVYALLNGTLYRSTNYGAAGSFSSILGGVNSFAIDGLATTRLVALTSGGVRESLDGGTNFTKNWGNGGSGFIALPTFQGKWQADPSNFLNEQDNGSNNHDTRTIYTASGTFVFVTKDGGVTWVTRPVVGFTGQIADLIVDPSNRDTLYVVSNRFGGGKVFKSTNAGQSWTDLTGSGATALPDVPVWKIVLDPRNGDLYVGTDRGVYKSIGGGANWKPYSNSAAAAPFGLGMPNVQVRDIYLDQTQNTLTVATYGRSMYQIWLNNTVSTADTANTGALRALAGSIVWTGPVQFTGPTTINVSGQTTLQNGVSSATLEISGVISDLSATTPTANTLTKNGGGTLILSGTNTYGGVTDITAGIVVANNLDALGAATDATNGTIVRAGAALELENDLEAETVTLNGDGIPFDDHNTGALRNISNPNTFTGTLILNTDTTIGVDSGLNSSLTIGPKAGLRGSGTITGAHNLVKESLGTLILTSANSYGPASGTFQLSVPGSGGVPATNWQHGTLVTRGVLNIQHGNALGANGNTTTVLDGAQLQVQGGITVDANQNLRLTGTGINLTGALQSVSGINHWQGPILFRQDPAFNPATTPGTVVSIGVTPAGDANRLIIDGRITDTGNLGLNKVGVGTLVLNNNTNSYDGLTNVIKGVLRIEQGAALGSTANGTVVQTGAALELDSVPTASGSFSTPVGETLTLNGQGISPGNAGALRNLTGNNTWAGTVILETSSFIGADSGTQLTISGTLRDVTPTATVPSPDLTKVGTGTLVFPNTSPNTYTGATFINAGVLNVQKGTATVNTTQSPLGSVVNEQQLFTLQNFSNNSFFRLTFTNPVTGVPRTTADLKADFNGTGTNPTFLADIKSALEALSNMNGFGTVSVAYYPTPGTPSTSFTITFDGGLLTGRNQVQVTGAASPGYTGTVASSTLRDGSEGTFVASGATLQLQGGISISSEDLSLNGVGFNSMGALENVSGDNSWSTAAGKTVTLTGNTTIGVDVNTNTLTINQGIGQSGGTFGVTKIGPGILQYAGGAGFDNTYTGTTSVNDGVLQLNKSGGATAIAGNLVVGNSTPGNTKTDVVRLLQGNQIADTKSVTVNSDGLFDLNDQTEVISPLTSTDGTVTTGAGTHGAQQGQLTVTTLTMTGGTLSMDKAGSSTTLGGKVTATSDSAGRATITGLGSLSLGGTDRTFTVSNGPNATDLFIDAPIVNGASAAGITKDDTGLLLLAATNSYTGTTIIKAGTLEVDGTIKDVSMAGGTLQGIGTVGAITSAAAGGTVAPGNGPGTLFSGVVTWNPATTLSVQIAGLASYDQLRVTGTVDLGGADLIGSIDFTGYTPALGHDFTILKSTDTISGTFSRNGVPLTTLFIDGLKFSINVVNSGSTHEVHLTIIPAATVTSMTNADVRYDAGTGKTTITATVKSEQGATYGLPLPGELEFYDHGVLIGSSADPGNPGIDPVTGKASITLALPSVFPTWSYHSITAAYVPATGDFFTGSSTPSSIDFGDQQVTAIQAVTTGGALVDLGNPLLTNIPLSEFTPFKKIQLTFQRQVDLSTIIAANITLKGPDGVSPPSIPLIFKDLNPGTDTLWELDFPDQGAVGVYTLAISQKVADFTGTPMDQNHNGQNGESPGDQFTGKFTVDGLIVTSVTPNNPLSYATGVRTLKISFNIPVDTTSFDPTSDLVLKAPNGATVDLTGATTSFDSSHTVATVSIPDQPALHIPGKYTLTVGPNILDTAGNQTFQLAGNAMNQDHDGLLGEMGIAPSGDQFEQVVNLPGLAVVSFTTLSGGTLIMNPSSALTAYSALITFNGPVEAASFQTDDLQLLDPNGNPVTLTGLAPTDGTNTVWKLDYQAALIPGAYKLTVGTKGASDIHDQSGTGLDQNQNGVTGESGVAPAGDAYTSYLIVNGLRVTAMTPNTAPNSNAVTSITLTFSAPVKPSSFMPSQGDIVLSGPLGNIPLTDAMLTPVAGTDNKQWVIDIPDQNLPGTYTIQVGPNILDIAGNLMNQFVDPGSVPIVGQINDKFVGLFTIQGLQVVSITLPGGTNTVLDSVGLSEAIITFSTPVDPTLAGFTTGAVTLLAPGSSTPINMTTPAFLPGSNTEVRVTFPKQTTPGAYTLTVGPTVKDAAGAPLDQDNDGMAGETNGDDKFDATLTVEGLDVVSATPNTVLANPGLTSITVVFNEPVQLASIKASGRVTLSGPNGDISPLNFSLTNGGTTLVITFAAQTVFGNYSLSIDPNILSTGGQKLNRDKTNPPGQASDRYSATFTAGITPTPVETTSTARVLTGVIDPNVIAMWTSRPKALTTRAARQLRKRYGSIPGLSAGRGKFFQLVTLINISDKAIRGPVAVQLSGLKPSLRVKNSTGISGGMPVILGVGQSRFVPLFRGDTFIVVYQAPGPQDLRPYIRAVTVSP